MLITLPVLAQRVKVETYTIPNQFKRHFSYSIEAAIKNGEMRQYVVGNLTDWGVYSDRASGHSFGGLTPLVSKWGEPVMNERDKVHLTDFTVYPESDFRYAAATGIYYPDGVNGLGYVFLAIYDDATSSVQARYFDLLYPDAERPNTVGTRVKYSRDENAYYISGVMLDRPFADIDIYNIQGQTEAFILKVDAGGWLAPYALVINPDVVPVDEWLCTIADIEISPDGQMIGFTGVNTREGTYDYHHPMVGLVDMNLDLQWCYVYEIREEKYSGIDVEFTSNDLELLVLLNSRSEPFAVMKLAYDGMVAHQPVKRTIDVPWSANVTQTRGHIMHYNANNTITITGNSFGYEGITEYQMLFRYDIDTWDLTQEVVPFTYYSTELVPLGSQRGVYSYWAPENSVNQQGDLYLTGVYNNANNTFGFTFINESNILPVTGCVDEGEARTYRMETELHEEDVLYRECRELEIETIVEDFNPEYYVECQRNKSGNTAGSSKEGMNFEVQQIDGKTVYAILHTPKDDNFTLNVYDIQGKQLKSLQFEVSKGSNSISFELPETSSMYVIRISNGVMIKNVKVVKP